MDYYYIKVIAVTAVVTYLIRMIPLVIFKKEITSTFWKSFFYYIPYAVLGAMTFPAILYSTRSMISALAGFVTACVASFFNRGLLTSAILASVAVYVAELILCANGIL